MMYSHHHHHTRSASCTHGDAGSPKRRRRRHKRGSFSHGMHCHGKHGASHGGRGGHRRPGGGHGHGGRRARRGDVRTAILLLLREQPYNGYQLMQEIKTRSEDAWRPSPGSMYPALSLLEDEGLILARADEGAKAFELTEPGRVEADALAQKHPTPPWAPSNFHPATRIDVRETMKEFSVPLRQILLTGTPAQVAAAQKIIDDARRALYLILAEAPEDAPR